jgi:hypothetical protein
MQMTSNRSREASRICETLPLQAILPFIRPTFPPDCPRVERGRDEKKPFVGEGALTQAVMVSLFRFEAAEIPLVNVVPIVRVAITFSQRLYFLE